MRPTARILCDRVLPAGLVLLLLALLALGGAAEAADGPQATCDAAGAAAQCEGSPDDQPASDAGQHEIAEDDETVSVDDGSAPADDDQTTPVADDPATSAADDQPTPADDTRATAGDDQVTAAAAGEPAASAIELTVVPVVGDGADDGDLVEDPGTGIMFLSFISSDPAPQRAVFDFTVRNTGDQVLQDVAVTDDRAGTVLAASDGTTLAPGEEVQVRGALTFTYEDAATGPAGIFRSTATATATDEGGGTVTSTAQPELGLVAIAANPTVDLQFEVVPGAGDVADGDPPAVGWSPREADDDAPKVVTYRVTLTNTGPVTLEQADLAVDVLPEPLLTPTDGVVLAPGEEWTREFERPLRLSDVVGPGPLVATATISMVDPELGGVARDSDQAMLDIRVLQTTETEVLGVVLEAPKAEEQLPSAGLDAPEVALLAALSLALGMALLAQDRRLSRLAAARG